MCTEKKSRDPGRSKVFALSDLPLCKENNARSAPPPKRHVAPNCAPESAGLEPDGDRLG